MSTAFKKTIVIILVIFTVSLLIGIAIYFYTTLNQTAKNESFHIERIETAENLKEMVEAADVIALGNYEGLHSTVNMIRDEEDPTQESTEKYLGGKVYGFHIDTLLKGNAEEEQILIAHRYSDQFNIEETLGHQDKEVEQADPSFINPSFEKTYIVFIKQPGVSDFYTQSMEPYMMTVNQEEIVEMKSNIKEELDFDDTISGKKLSDVETEIDALK